MNLIYELSSTDGVLKVFEDKVTIFRPKFTLLHGREGTTTFDFTSITAVQFREAGALVSGYIRFAVPDAARTVFGTQQGGGIFNFTGRKNNPTAVAIKDYVEAALRKLRAPASPTPTQGSLPEEIAKLASLKQQGLLTEQEFEAAKKKLIG